MLAGVNSMKKIRLLALAALLLGGNTVRALEAGASKIRIALPEGVPLAGDAERMGREAVGEHDTLWSRCLYLDDGTNAVYLVNVDLWAIPRALREQVVALAAEFATPESIILTATHTSNGPGGLDERLPLRWESGRYHPELLEMVGQVIVDTMSVAREEKRRATLGYGTSKQTAKLLAISENSREPNGPTDDQIGVIRVDDADGRAIAIVTNFAAEPAVAPRRDHLRFSAGFPGAYYRKMEELADPGCVALFLNGAAGDQQPANPENKEGWERVESIGRLLAERAKAVANDMTFRDVALKANLREVALPASLAGAFLPETALLQSLEIDGLLMVFVPGEPCIELGLALRRQALAAGFKAQFTVGPANGDLMQFVPRSCYAKPGYASAKSFFGPAVEDWLYTQVAALVEYTDPVAGRPHGTAAKREPIAGGTAMTFTGPGYPRGYQRGEAFQTRVQSLYQEHVAAAVGDGDLRPVEGLWGAWPPLLDPAALALPALAASARPMLAGLSGDVFSELEGFADGAGLPFDAAWLLQNAPDFATSPQRDGLYAAPLCTVFAVVGERAGANGAIVGCNLDWLYPETPLVSVVQPDEGHGFIQVGFDWQLGALTGMNDAGVVLGVERNTALGEGGLSGLPVAFVVRDLLQHAATYDEALAGLKAAFHLRGYQVLLVAQGAERWAGAVVSYGKAVTVRVLEDGLLLGVDPDEDDADAATAARYRQVVSELAGVQLAGPGDLQRVLASGGSEVADMSRVWNAMTRHSVVAVPALRTMYVSFPTEDGLPGAYTEFRLPKGTPQ